ncbi:uncharacterized protein LOC135483865 [Lineus longissimus]|uniref:uncharacterized protein LOC135483865 n=1 Tax=Lineus longissimus TaxID=88925 RepID=UPI00315C7280
MPLNTILSFDVLQPWTPEELEIPDQFLKTFENMQMQMIAERMKNEPFAQGDWLRRIRERFFKSDCGPIEQAFLPMFSMMEIVESKANPGGGTMGMDPHYDARQSYYALARFVEKNLSPVCILLKNGSATALINLDIITFEGNKVWCLKEYPKEPIIFVRCTFLPMRTPLEKDPYWEGNPNGVAIIKCASKEEMDIHLRVFRENASNISLDLKAKVDACVEKKLLDIAMSFTSYFTLLLPEEKSKLPTFCRVCGAEGRKTCSKCKVAKYCSKECQVKDWKASHKRECRPPEEVADVEAATSDADVKGNGRNMWIDIDPRAEVPVPPEMEGSNVVKSPTQSFTEPLHRFEARVTRAMSKIGHEGEMLDRVKRDVIMMVKVQIILCSTGNQHECRPILIYPQGKRFELDAVPENMGRGVEDYSRLQNLIKAQGTDSGLGMGGCKVFLDAYVTSEGKLRVMLNKVNPLQTCLMIIRLLAGNAKMPVSSILGIDSLQPWLPDKEDEQMAARIEISLEKLSVDEAEYGPLAQEILRRRAKKGPVEQAFIPMFSMGECEESFEPGGTRMGVDPHYDARQGILVLAGMVDKQYSRAAIYKMGCENTMGVLNVDIVSLDGTTAWCSPDHPKEPIIFVRCAFLPGMTNAESEPFRYHMHTCISKTVPSIGLNNIKCTSRDELDIYLQVFKENATKMSPELKAKIEAGVGRSLLDIPTSFTSFFTLLLPDLVPRPPTFCRVCGAEGLKTCSKCKMAKYCSKECQVKDWKASHKRECRPPEEVAIAEAATSDAGGNHDGQDLWLDVDPKATTAHYPNMPGQNVVSFFRSTSNRDPLYRDSRRRPI